MKYGKLFFVVMAFVASIPIETSVAQTYRIYIDPGHGGDDPGSIAIGDPGCFEKDINLSVALELENIFLNPPDIGLQQNEINYLFTFTTDSTVEPRPRARLANNYMADIFVSIHHNALLDDSTTQRIETLFSSDTTECCDFFDSTQSIGCCLAGQARKDTSSLLAEKLGYYIEQHSYPMELKPPIDKGDSISVLSRTYMASTITEALYITEQSGADKFCNSGTALESAIIEASALFNGISSYLKGGGIAIVEYNWLTKDYPFSTAPTDVWVDTIETQLEMLYEIPYRSAWLEGDTIWLRANDFSHDLGVNGIFPYIFHHWERRWYSTDWQLDYYDSTSTFKVEVPLDFDSTHYYVAYFQGGPYEIIGLNSISGFPPDTIWNDMSVGDSVYIEWLIGPGVDTTTTCTVDLERNSSGVWVNIQTSNWFADDLFKLQNWQMTGPGATNCRFRIIASDTSGNTDTVYTNYFGVCDPFIDSDCDFTPNFVDNCPLDSNPTQSNSDNDFLGDACDNCPLAYNPQQEDLDGDAIGDSCDGCIDVADNGSDADLDGIPNACDNCPTTANTGQENADGDLCGDACEVADVLAGFSVDTTVGTAPLAVLFFNNSLNADSLFLDFGDGSSLTDLLLDDTLNHIYTQPGTYTVTQIAYNSCTYDTLVIVDLIQVDSAICVPPDVTDFTSSDSSGEDSVFVIFNAVGTGAQTISYLWDFGDGSSHGPTNTSLISHTFVGKGRYTVSLTATDSCNLPVIITKPDLISVNCSPAISFISNPPGPFTDTVPFGINTFLDSAANDPSAIYIWDFGDGGERDTGTSFLYHLYDNAGVFDITVIAQSACGSDTSVFPGYVTAHNSRPPIVWQVAVTGNDNNDGLTLQTAFATIQHAINVSINADQVQVRQGVYSGTGNVNVNFQGKAIRVFGATGWTTVIDCAGGSNRAFVFDQGETSSSKLENFKIINGDVRNRTEGGFPSEQGGALLIRSSPEIKLCKFENCKATVGGAIHIWKLPNQADATPQISYCSFQGNEANSNTNGTVDGGAILCASGAQPTIEFCSFYDNYSKGSGAGIFASASASNVTISDCIFVRNRADGQGGGGAIFSQNSLSINSCTITKNDALFGAGILAGNLANINIQSSIIAFNTGAGLQTNAGSAVTFYCNDFWGNTGGDIVGILGPGNVDGYTIFEDPIFCDSDLDNYYISSFSQCDELNSPCGLLIGRYDNNCTLCCDVPGDADNGGDVNIGDAQFIQAFIFQNGSTPPCCDEADANGGGEINVSDVLYIVAFIFQGGPAPLCPTVHISSCQ